MKKLLPKLFAFFAILLIPFSVFFIVVERLPDQYDNTYLAELNDKYHLLCETNGKKIVFVGGSSLPFGLRSDLVEQELPEYKVVDFGLYATLGTKAMMDLSLANINPGDIVVLAPELAEQTYSLYFNPEAMLQACDGFAWKYRYLSATDNLSLFYHYWKFAFDKIGYIRSGDKPDPVGIYRHDSFNEYGDIAVERAQNIMNGGVDSTVQITTTEALLQEDFLAYVNDYCRLVRNKGAKIYFQFSPCNELAMASSAKKRAEFQDLLAQRLTCDLLSDLEDCIMDYRYFYDTNYHLNSPGAVAYTDLLVSNLKKKLDIKAQNGGGNSSISVPLPPEIEEGEVTEPLPKDDPTPFNEYRGEANNDYQDWFEYKLVGSSWQIVGVKEAYRDMEEVILPSTYQGRNITTLGQNALLGCVHLKAVHIGLTYKTLEEKAFNGAVGLQRIYLYATDGNTITPSSDMLLGCSENVKIYIPRNGNYRSGYTWFKYSDYFVEFDTED